MSSEPRDEAAGPDAATGAASPLRVEEAGGASPQQRVEELIEDHDDAPAIAEVVERQAAADAADTLERLEEEQAADVLEQMDDRLAAQALAEMQTPLAVGVVDDLLGEDLAYAARLLGFMAPDDAADLLQALGPARAERLLAAMPLDRAFALRKLVGSPSPPGHLTTEFAALRAGMTVAEAIEFSGGDGGGLQHPAVGRRRQAGHGHRRDLLLGRACMHAEPRSKRSRRCGPASTATVGGSSTVQLHRAGRRPDDRVLGIVTVDDGSTSSGPSRRRTQRPSRRRVGRSTRTYESCSRLPGCSSTCSPLVAAVVVLHSTT
jgi:hypothetical protein